MSKALYDQERSRNYVITFGARLCGMPFHQFMTSQRLVAFRQSSRMKNPLDFLMSIGLKKYGVDMLAEYLSRLSKNDPSIKPWLPPSLARDSFLIDLHCHTNLSDGEGTFESILARIGSRNIVDGILFSDHVWSLGKDQKTRIPNEKVLHQSYDAIEVVERLKRKRVLPEGFISFPGTAEFISRGTERFPKKTVELIGTGLPRPFIAEHGGLSKLKNLLAEDLVDLIHGDGGIAILVHPFYLQNSSSPRLWRMADAIEAFNQSTHVFVEPATRNFVKRFSGEVPLVQEAFGLQALFGYFAWRVRVELERHQRPEVGGSDAHVECFAGAGCTLFNEPITSLEDFRKALQRKETRAIMNPRWEAQAEIENIIDAIWNHWGKKFVQTLIFLNSKLRGVIPLIKIASGILKEFKDKAFTQDS